MGIGFPPWRVSVGALLWEDKNIITSADFMILLNNLFFVLTQFLDGDLLSTKFDFLFVKSIIMSCRPEDAEVELIMETNIFL